MDRTFIKSEDSTFANSDPSSFSPGFFKLAPKPILFNKYHVSKKIQGYVTSSLTVADLRPFTNFSSPLNAPDAIKRMLDVSTLMHDHIFQIQFCKLWISSLEHILHEGSFSHLSLGHWRLNLCEKPYVFTQEYFLQLPTNLPRALAKLVVHLRHSHPWLTFHSPAPQTHISLAYLCMANIMTVGDELAILSISSKNTMPIQNRRLRKNQKHQAPKQNQTNKLRWTWKYVQNMKNK